MLVGPSAPLKEDNSTERGDVHPDPKMDLGEQDLFKEIRERRASSEVAVGQAELYWLLDCGLVLFFIHLARMQSGETWLGGISPVVAVLDSLAWTRNSMLCRHRLLREPSHARAPLPSAAVFALRMGLPISILLVAVNPIWASAGTSIQRAGRAASTRRSQSFASTDGAPA